MRLVMNIDQGESMKVIKNRIIPLSVILLLAVITQNALAMPYSSYIDPYGETWTGQRTESQNGIDIKVEWTVYDLVNHSNEFAWAGINLTGDNYAYVYKITNLSGDEIGSFSMLDNPGDTDVIDWSSRINGTQAVEPGIMPDSPSELQGIWEWPSGNFASAGAASAYLIFGSVYAPKAGDYMIEAPSGDKPVPGTPEPASLALFGIAAAIASAKRGRKLKEVQG